MSYPASSKFDGDLELIEALHDLGFKAMDQWLTENFDKIGQVSTMPIDELNG